jgi:hypothetical protein
MRGKSMRRAPKFVATALILAAAALQPACSNDSGSPGILGNAANSSASQTSKKFWDRCINTECPPMNEDEGRAKKPQ